MIFMCSDSGRGEFWIHVAHSDINVVYRPSYRNGQVELHIPYGNKATWVCKYH